MRLRRLARLVRSVVVVVVVIGLAADVSVASAAPRQTIKKSIWGDFTYNGVSEFPIYKDLGVGLFQTGLPWVSVAAARPANPRDPKDPAYHWPADLDWAIGEAKKNGMKLSLLVSGTPPWANNGQASNFAPSNPKDYADFVEAASKRYPSVHHWMIWGEPSRQENWMPLAHVPWADKPTRAEGAGARRYARMLDAAYAALKSANHANIVIGGNSFLSGDIGPFSWIDNLKLPNGKPPRMDLYGHNPFGLRKPDLSLPLYGPGLADFSDLDELAKAVDKRLAKPRNKKRIRLFLSEYQLPTDHANYEFSFHLTREAQASFIKAALRITRHWSEIYSLGYHRLRDDPPRPDGLEVNRGLIDATGVKKPGYFAFRDG
jgi:hypothetical protein